MSSVDSVILNHAPPESIFFFLLFFHRKTVGSEMEESVAHRR
jgi:hypothetical protein